MKVLDKTLEKRVRSVSKKLGLPEQEVVHRAVATYLENMEDLGLLQRELSAWDALSAETMRIHAL